MNFYIITLGKKALHMPSTTMRRMRMRPAEAQQSSFSSPMGTSTNCRGLELLWFKLLFVLFVVTLLLAQQQVGVNAHQQQPQENQQQPLQDGRPPPPLRRRILLQQEGFRRVAIQGSLEPCFLSVHRRFQRGRQLQQQEGLSSNNNQHQLAAAQRRRRRRRLAAAASCIQKVQAEQAEIAAMLKRSIPTATIVDARQRLVNVQFALVPNDVSNKQVEQIIMISSATATSSVTGQEKAAAVAKKKKNTPLHRQHRVLSSHDFPVVQRDHGSTILAAAQNDDDQVGPILPNSTDDIANMPSIFTVAEYLGFDAIHKQYCLQGEGIVVAVLDSGIDYTHDVFGGLGTVEAYEAAWGSINSSSSTLDLDLDGVMDVDDEDLQKRQQRDGFFPTNVIIEGYDFLGDDKSVNLTLNESSPDDDPMDGPEGHGTMVSSVIMAAAPAVKLLAVKVCNDVQCPDFSIIAGLEYALDPNGDGDTDDAADVANCKSCKIGMICSLKDHESTTELHPRLTHTCIAVCRFHC